MTSTTAEILPGFACPSEEGSLFRHAVTGHGPQIMAQVLIEQGSRLADVSPRLHETVREAAQAEDAFDLCWDPVMGDLHALALGAHERHAIDYFAQLALLANSLGLSGVWEAPLGNVRLRLDRWLLPGADEVYVASGTDELEVRGRSGGVGWEYRFERSTSGWAHDGGCEALERMDADGFATTIITPDALSVDAARRLLSADAYRFDVGEAHGCNGEWRRALHEAIDLLRRTAPGYLPWIDRVLKYLLPLQARPGTLNSGGERFTPGVVCLSNQPFAFPLAEMLVHESAHHYMHVLMRLGALEDGSDTALYHSPFRGKDRPVFFILVAYHAFANVLLFYRRARRAGYVPPVLDGYAGLENRELTLERQLRSIEPILRGCRGLTDLGHSLWVPLHDALHEHESS